MIYNFKTKGANMDFEEIFNTLEERVVKENKFKRSYRILRNNNRTMDKHFFKKFLFWAKENKGLIFSPKYDGFIIEELEYTDVRPVKTMKEMQEEFIKNNEITKCDSNKDVYLYGAMNYMSKSHYNKTMELNKHKKIDFIFDRMTFYSPDGKVRFEFYEKGQKNGVDKITNKIGTIKYYKMNKYVNDSLLSRIVKESTIFKKLEEGLIVRKEDIKKTNTKEVYTIDDSYWDFD